MTPFLSPRWLAILAFTGMAQASVPGVYAIQETRIAGPNSAVNDLFGGSEPRWVGDINGDGIQDMVIGTPAANKDTGALVFQTMSYQGGVRQTALLTPRDPAFAGLVSNSRKEQFGTAVAVVLPFSSTRSCAILATTSAQTAKLWTLKVCRDPQGPLNLLSVKKVDTSTGSPLSGMGLGASLVGSLQMVDTMSTGERVVALGMTSASSTNGMQGRVVLLKVDTTNLTATRLSYFPEAWDDNDLVGQSIPSNARFGQSVVRLGNSNGQLQLGVLATGTIAGSYRGRLHRLVLDGSYHLSSTNWRTLGVGSDTVPAPTSISAADFDHDGQTDLLVGSPATSAAQSGFWVATLEGTARVLGLQPFVPGTNGFADSFSVLGTGSVLGSTVLAGDLNQDGMVDAFVGAKGGASVAGALWSIRMKSAPWLVRATDTLFLAFPNPAYKMLSTYVGGKTQGWSVRDLNPLGASSPSSCRILGGGDTAELLCDPGRFNGISTWRITVYDTLNTPATVHVYDSLDFVVRNSGIVAYRFGSDTLKLAPKAGIDLVRALDTVDAQHDTLVYQGVGNWPAWLRLGRFSITAASPANQPDTVVKIAACKDLPPGPVVWCSDTAFVSVRFDGMTGTLRSRTALELSGRHGTLVAKGGSEPFRVEVFGTDGRLLGELAGGALASRTLDLRGGPATVLVRAKDGDKIRQNVVFLGR